MEEIGNQLKKARLAANLTQEEVAQKLFVTRQTVSRWEQDRNLPNVYALKDLSLLYQVDVQYFFGEGADESPEEKKIHAWALVGIVLFNLFFFLFAYFTMLMVLFCLWAATIVLILMPIIYQLPGVVTIYVGNHHWTPSLGLALILCGVGLAISPLIILLTKQVWRFTKHYIRYNIKSIYY
ncbi:helix-turn-helix domain-containing protein [Streptococcus dentasini]